MFCRYCGNELPDDAKFCNKCGKSLLDSPLSTSDPQNGDAGKDSCGGPVSQEPVLAIKQSEAAVVPKKKRRKMPLPAIFAIIAVAVIAIIFIERNNGNQDLVNRVIDSVSNQSEEQIANYYGKYFGISKDTGGYVLATNYTGVDVTWSGNDVTIKWPIEIKIQSGDQPAYTVDITLNAETNFMRSHISYQNDWTYSFETPDRSDINSALPESEDVVSMRTLFTAFDNNGITAINTYGGQYLNVSGIVGDIHTTYDGQTVVTFDYYYYNPNLGYSFDQMNANFIFADPSDPNLSTLEKDKVAIITGYMSTSYNGYSLEFGDCRVYGGAYSDDSYSYPSTENNYPDEPQYGDHGELTENSPDLPVNLGEPFGYYEKANGEGGFSIEYISDDDSVRIEYYMDGQPGYYGGHWFEPNFYMSCDYIDFSSDNVLEFVDNDGNCVIRFDAYESYITITASEPLYGVTVDRMNGNYYCKIQSSILQ